MGLCAEYKECFSLYDKEQRGKIKATDLMVVMRCLGASPTPGEVQRHLQTHQIDRNGELDFSTFLTIMHVQMKQEDPKKEILLAMLMADKEKKGYIMASELRSKLMKLGEKLTYKEVDELFREANIEPNGKVKETADQRQADNTRLQQIVTGSGNKSFQL
nr:calmodulin-like protein 4 isoform X1 [Loxodonta africana]